MYSAYKVFECKYKCHAEHVIGSAAKEIDKEMNNATVAIQNTKTIELCNATAAAARESLA